MEYHPDRNDGDINMFQKIKNAYDILSNKVKRERYDKFGFEDDSHRVNLVRDILLQIFNTKDSDYIENPFKRLRSFIEQIENDISKLEIQNKKLVKEIAEVSNLNDIKFDDILNSLHSMNGELGGIILQQQRTLSVAKELYVQFEDLKKKLKREPRRDMFMQVNTSTSTATGGY